jgi:hypothetical protein
MRLLVSVATCPPPNAKLKYKNGSHISIPFLGSTEIPYSFFQCSLVSIFPLLGVAYHPIVFCFIFFRTTAIYLRLAGAGNDLAQNFPWEPLDGRCVHKSSWEIIVTCCLGPMLEEKLHIRKFSHTPVFSFTLWQTRSFFFFNAALFCVLHWCGQTERLRFDSGLDRHLFILLSSFRQILRR